MSAIAISEWKPKLEFVYWLDSWEPWESGMDAITQHRELYLERLKKYE